MAKNKINIDGEEIIIPTEYLKAVTVDISANTVTITTQDGKRVTFVVSSITENTL